MSESIDHTATANGNLQTDISGVIAQVSALLQTGKPVHWDQLIKQYPEFSDELLQIRPVLEGLVALGSSIDSTGLGSDQLERSDTNTPQALGDFRIIKEIGRGGMGVVYEAQQLSIARRVALKVLPLVCLIDERALQRFKNEVGAIATLHHPNIISVYSIGEERGIHYFAMELVRGQSLAAVIRELKARSEQNVPLSGDVLSQVVSDMEEIPATSADDRSAPADELIRKQEKPIEEVETRARAAFTTKESRGGQSYFRNAVRLIVQAAEALQHAHEYGVVHRDIKPGNLLLDKRGSLFITDFGLARIEAGAGVTMTGDVIGTLRYMSPEQVLAGRVLIDHRTDVYSLGATLYELAALQPIWSGNDRADLISKISFEEPVRPQLLNASIPTDLETIILKAITKSPDERYESAQALADDLQRFLDNKSVVAKRPTILQRAGKWTKRNPTIMWSTIAVLFLAVVGLLLGNHFIARERADKVAALNKAETEFATVKAVIEFVNTDLLGSPEIGSNPQLTVGEILDDSVIALESDRFASRPLVDATIRETIGRAFANLARYEDAHEQLSQSFGTFERLLGSDNRKTLSVENDLIRIYFLERKYVACESRGRALVGRCRRSLGEDDELTLKATKYLLDTLNYSGKIDAALKLGEDLFVRAERILGANHRLTLMTKRVVYEQGENSVEYEKILWQLVTEHGIEHNSLVDLLSDMGRYDEVETIVLDVLEMRKRNYGAYHPQTLFWSHKLAKLFRDRGENAKAIKFMKGIHRDALANLGKDNLTTVVIEARLGIWLITIGGAPEEAEQLLRRSNEMYTMWSPEHPNFVIQSSYLGRSLLEQQRYAEAEELFPDVIRHCQFLLEALRHGGKLLAMKENLAWTIDFMADNYDQTSNLAKTENLIQELLIVGDKIWNEDDPKRGKGHLLLGNILSKQDRITEAVACFRNAVEWQQRYSTDDQLKLKYTKRLIDCLREQGNLDEAAILSGDLNEVEEDSILKKNP